MQRRFEVTYPDGDTDELEATTLEEAREEARDGALEGDWHEGEGAAVWCALHEIEDDLLVETHRLIVDIPPDHELLIRQAVGRDAEVCGYDPEDHDWTSEGEGGCTENPGVWSRGGTTFVFASHCRRCGLHRTERDPGSQRNPGEHPTVEYELEDASD